MPTKRSRSGDRSPSDRVHVGMTLPRRVKASVLEAADALDWSAGDWVLAAAAEHGPRLRQVLGRVELRKRPKVEDAAFTALYLTAEERQELDDQAVACGLNRSAFVTSVARLAFGDELDEVVAPLRAAGAGSVGTGDGGAGGAVGSAGGVGVGGAPAGDVGGGARGGAAGGGAAGGASGVGGAG